MRIGDLTVVYISYDEPCAEEFWADLLSKCPQAKRVHGVAGLDGAHKEAARRAETDHFVTVDADNIVDPAFFHLRLDEGVLRPTTRISWPGRNVVNGLVYGGGALKVWPRDYVLSMRTHENAEPGTVSVDLEHNTDLERQDGPFNVDQPFSFSAVHVNRSPLQAFRSGFRAGVRFSLAGTELPLRERRPRRLHPISRHRLLIWCSIGADAANGLWCVYGARLGCHMANLTDWSYTAINDFGWIGRFWREDVWPRFEGTDARCPWTGYAWDPDRLQAEAARLGETLRERLDLDVSELDAAASRFFKQIYAPPARGNVFDILGNMFRRGVGVARDRESAVQAYRIGAAVGDTNAMSNLGQMLSDGEAGAKDVGRAVALFREATALGNRFAPFHLGRMYRDGLGVARASADALELFELASRRGFLPAHAEIARMYEQGDGVARDLGRAVAHYRIAVRVSPELGAKLAELERQLGEAGE